MDIRAIYKELENDLRKECYQMVVDGELTAEEAYFRFSMKRDEIWESLVEELNRKEDDKL